MILTDIKITLYPKLDRRIKKTVENLKERYRSAINDIRSVKVIYDENLIAFNTTHYGYINLSHSEDDWAGNIANDGKYFNIDDYNTPCFNTIENDVLIFVEYTNKLKINVSSYAVAELVLCVFDKYKILAKHNEEYGTVTIFFDV